MPDQKYFVRSPVFLTALFLLCAAIITMGAPVAAADYTFTTSISSPVQKTISLQAVASPRHLNEVQAPRDGVISAIYAFPGDRVSSKGILAQLDDTDLRTEKRRLQAERNEFSGHLRRIEDLVKKDLIGADIWDNNLQKLAQIRAELAIIDEKIKNSRIIAPEGGNVLWSELKVGQQVKGADILYWTGDEEKIWLSATVEQNYLSDIEPGKIIAAFTGKDSAPAIGEVEFIGPAGPQADDDAVKTIYMNAPRRNDIGINQTYPVLIPIETKTELTILPESALSADGYIYELGAVLVEPDKYYTRKKKAEIQGRQNGIITVKNVAAETLVLLNPEPSLKNGSIITAFEETSNDNWGEAYTAALLQKENQALADGSCGGGGGCGGNGSAGGCGAAMAGTIQMDAAAPTLVCDVPSSIFNRSAEDIPKSTAEENSLDTPHIPEDLPTNQPPPANS